ncbi:hypothetical protein ONZ45_g2027 [Pleurotus djamor]|nr:hypothetical protein ONZ45_g2027 [Pleurotus djamor]
MSWFYHHEGAIINRSAGKNMCARDFLQDTRAKLQDRLLDHDELRIWRLTPSLQMHKAMAVLNNSQFITKLSENQSEAVWAFDHFKLERVTSDSAFVTEDQGIEPLFVDFFVCKYERIQRSADLNLDDRYSDTFIKVTDWGSFCQDDLRLNMIRELQDTEDVPRFVEEFKQKLFQSTTLSNDSPERYHTLELSDYCGKTAGTEYSPAFSQIITDVLPEKRLLLVARPDRLRLILCACSTVRFANNHLPPFTKNKDFTLLAFYVRSDGKYDQMIFFQQPNDATVYYTSNSVNLEHAAKRAEMALCLNNLVHMLSLTSSADLTTIKNEITAFSQSVSRYNKRHKLKSFYTKGSQAQAEGQDARTSQGVSDAINELTSHGYDVEPDIIDCGGWEMERLDKLPPHLFFVRSRSDSAALFIAKKTSAHEIHILKFIRDCQPPSSHIIQLLDSFQGSSAHYAILPYIPHTLSRYIDQYPKQLSEHASSICGELVAAVAYLHRHGIAHRDIKPDNCLIDDSSSLMLSDFDVACRVVDEVEEVTDYCGTEGWIAPEIEKRVPKYSPIKADRWSCGRVILCVLNRINSQNHLRAVATKLMRVSPNERPSLVDVMNQVYPPQMARSSSSGDSVESSISESLDGLDTKLADTPSQAPLALKPLEYDESDLQIDIPGLRV